MAHKGELLEFIDELGKVDYTDNETFQDVFFQGAELFHLDDKEIRSRFGYSSRALAQWKNGEDLPHRGVRKVIFKMLGELAQERLA